MRAWHLICPSRLLTLSILSIAASSFAQTERGYIGGIGGFAVSAATTSPRVTSGDVAIEAGARIAPGLLFFGDVGRINDLTPSTSQAQLADAVTTLSSADAVDVVGTARMPARYALGGLRWQARASRRVTPFVLGGLGVAHLTPTAAFTFTDGTLPGSDPSAAAPATGDDVTTQIATLGIFTPPAPSTALMIAFGGGGARHRAALGAGHRVSRVADFCNHGAAHTRPRIRARLPILIGAVVDALGNPKSQIPNPKMFRPSVLGVGVFGA